MTSGRFVAYLRVSTDKQGRNGLGIEAQRDAIAGYLNGGSWELLAEFKEVESGKNSKRPQLQEAMNECRRTGATLVIAKLDRLSRDPDFIGMMMKSSIDFVACDMPEANKFTIRIMAALAEKERELISERTTAALKASKVRLGIDKFIKPMNATPEGRAKGIALSRELRQRKADQFAMETRAIIEQYQRQDENISLRGIAAKLNERKVLTASGKVSTWTHVAVKNVLDRKVLPTGN